METPTSHRRLELDKSRERLSPPPETSDSPLPWRRSPSLPQMPMPPSHNRRPLSPEWPSDKFLPARLSSLLDRRLLLVRLFSSIVETQS